MERQRTQLLKLKILHKESITQYLKQKRTSELEDKMVEITSEEQNKVKRMKRTEDNLRDLWDNIKLQGSQKKEYEKFFEEIIVEKFPNMEKKVAKQVQEAQRVPHRINPRKNTPRHILIKLTKTKH